MTSWSSASSGGGGAGRSARSRVSFTSPGYEVLLLGRHGLHRVRRRDVLMSTPTKVTDEDSYADQD
jgi:hypothetical protein